MEGCVKHVPWGVIFLLLFSRGQYTSIGAMFCIGRTEAPFTQVGAFAFGSVGLRFWLLVNRPTVLGLSIIGIIGGCVISFLLSWKAVMYLCLEDPAVVGVVTAGKGWSVSMCVWVDCLMTMVLPCIVPQLIPIEFL